MALAPPTTDETLVEQRGRAMGTDVQVVVIGGHDDIATRCFTRLEQLEQKWSRFRDDSEISVINAALGKPVIVSDETIGLVSRARDGAIQTNGLFDPTIGAAVIAAGYGRSFDTIVGRLVSRTAPPNPAPGWTAIELDQSLNAVRLSPGTKLDLGGIGKGAAADIIVSEVMASGAVGICLNIGGDIRVEGTMPGDRPWPITLECPGAETEIQLNVRGGAVCTSTTLRRQWQTDRGTRHHLIDPRSGMCTASGLVSVSVLAATATAAEVITKAALVGGPETARRIVRDHRLSAVLVHTDGEVERLNTRTFEIG